MKMISDAEVEKKIRAWADITLLSLALKRAALKEKRSGKKSETPDYTEQQGHLKTAGQDE